MEDQLIHKALHMAGKVLSQVKPGDMSKPTPCSEWDVRALLNHMIYEIAWIPPLLDGKTIAEVGGSLEGDLIGNDLTAAWHRFAEAALNAANSTPMENVAHLSYADKTVGEYLGETGVDIVVHGWDLSMALGVDYMIDDEVATAALASIKDTVVMARKAGMVGEKLPTDADDAPDEILLAEYGRSINWSA